MQETPMSYLYNVNCLLRTIRSVEENTATVSFTDEHGREVSFKGDIIKLDDFTRLVNGLRHSYQGVLAKIFFGKTIPGIFLSSIDIRSMLDDPRNFSPGYCFIDDPRNDLLKHRNAYAEWLLSDSNRAAMFTYSQGNRLIWKASPSFSLLKWFQEAREILVILAIVSSGPSVRGTEASRELLRNVTGAELRNVLILYHNFCIVSIQDKTSHRFLKSRFSPHCPPQMVSEDLLLNLTFYRPFEEMLVGYLLGESDRLRFHCYLWPNLRRNIASSDVSDLLGKATEKYLGTALKIKNYRNVSATLARRHGDPLLFEVSKQYYHDALQNHSTEMGNLKYGVEKHNMANADPRHIIGCTKVCIRWHDLINIAYPKPLRVASDDDVGDGPLIPELADDGQASCQVPSSAFPTRGELTRFSNSVAHACTPILENFTWDTMTEIMADLVSQYFPPAPPPKAADQLRQCSTVLAHPSRLRDLRIFLNDDNAKFKCPEQLELVEKMQAKRNHILGILSPGVGKTFLVLFQARMYERNLVTVVILPLSGLHADFERRCQLHDVSFSRWKPDGTFDTSCSIQYASVEHTAM
jgi:hypothetical protein